MTRLGLFIAAGDDVFASGLTMLLLSLATGFGVVVGVRDSFSYSRA